MANPAATPKGTQAASAAFDSHRVASLLHRKGFVLAVILGLLNFWITRFIIFSDGVSYLEIARRYASGNWNLAINAYWSPFYSWILAIARLLTGKNDRWELLSLHFINLSAYILALLLFERLLTYLWPECNTNASIQCRSFRICAYCLFLWATLHMIGIAYVSPDMLVLALNLIATILLLKIRQRPENHLLLVQLGTILAISYLCKAALLLISFVYFVVALWMGRRQGMPLKRIAALFLPFIALCVPWLIALHHHEGHWTFGESGKLNYAWEVDGAARSIHWQGEPGNIGTPLHPTRHIFSHPDIYEFGSPIDATYPPWFDPTYWYAGISPGLQLKNQLRTLAIYLRYVATLFCFIPGVLPAVLAAFVLRKGDSFRSGCLTFWFLLLPSVVAILLYCLVYVDKRYIAGPLLVIGLVALRSALPLLKNKKQLDLTIAAACAVCLAFVGSEIGMGTLRQIFAPKGPAITNQQLLIADEVRGLGLKPGDKIACIGVGMNAYWALLDGLKITADIPVTFSRDGTVKNYVTVDYGNPNQFWNSDAATRQQIFVQLKSLGIRAIAADTIPKGADSTGWIKLKGTQGVNYRVEHAYIRLL
jgi:hypothetical protein